VSVKKTASIAERNYDLKLIKFSSQELHPNIACCRFFVYT